MNPTRTAHVIFTAIVVTSCTTDATELVVWVNSDLTIPLSMISVQVTDADAQPIVETTVPIDERGLPLSFTISPGPEYIDRRVRVAVGAVDVAHSIILERHVLTGFVRDQRVLLPMFLAAQCLTLQCPASSAPACTERGCEPLEVPARSLKQIEPGDELEHDGGTPTFSRASGR